VSTTVVLFTRDLRVSDHPALHAAVTEADRVVPLFVVDPALVRVSARNRIAYLLEALAELRGLLRERGGELVVRQGDTVAETVRIVAETGAQAVYLSADVSAAAVRRARQLTEAVRAAGAHVRTFPGVTVVPPGALRPAHGDHYQIFTPYLNAWRAAQWRSPRPAPERVRLPEGLVPGPLPGAELIRLGTGVLAPQREQGGPRTARERIRAWLAQPNQDSRFGCHLHFGCLSPLEVALVAREHPRGALLLRQLALRDFHHQVLQAFPRLPRADYRPRPIQWRDDDSAFAAWCSGRTGVPIVDAGMRQLLWEGYVPGRIRMLTATYLTQVLRIHWKRGADHFYSLLVDGDVANNYGNWQQIAGTGGVPRPARRINLYRQAERYDPSGDYVRRFVPELRSISGSAVHHPPVPRPGGYPPPLR
jgi:deoxyribodipyrimidine photo-lyase